MGHTPRDPDFERRTRESFARQGDAAVLAVEFKLNLMAAAGGERAHAIGRVIRSGRTLTVCQLDVHVEKAGRRTRCAMGLQTLMGVVGRAGVKD